jgi:methionyl aminopeptidase
MVRIRSSREIEKIRAAGKIVYETFELLEDYIKPGIETRVLDKVSEEFIRSAGGIPAFKGYRGFPATLCISVDSQVVHGIPGKRILQEGDIIAIDCGVELDGYFGDSARTYAVGSIDPVKEKLMRVTEESLYKGIQQAVPGKRLSDIGHAIQSHVENYGFSVVRQLVGHGIGTELHEEPQVPNYGSPGKGIILKPGMVLAIEPMVNAGHFDVFTEKDGWTVCTMDGSPSAHFEHTVAITNGTAEILTDGR